MASQHALGKVGLGDGAQGPDQMVWGSDRGERGVTPAGHTIKHHNSCRSMDCTSGLLRKIFPDSVTAQKISSAEGDSVHPVQFQTHDLQGLSYLFDR